MPASISARNSGAYSRTRAAVLCFGGWGLQTMLHLWPRIRLIQEERQVLGIDRELPNLDRLTAFAAILPQTAPASGTQPVPPCHVLQPNLERYPAPFYLERQLASIEAAAAATSVPGLTYAERVGSAAAETRPGRWLCPTSPGDLPAARERWVRRAAGLARVDTFRAGIEAAGPIVRALLSQVIDPTRLDSMQSRDPLVQTTIYVIAPLSEPLASALVWPVVAELVGALRRRHVSRVIAFFSTASFAPDDGRAIEEATAHMARRELEALTGSAGQDDRPDLLSRLIADCGGAVWEERVGKRLFDVVHLIDREKSNQALAESALDLSVLAGNAVEAFLAADGLGHLERSLGPETVARSTGHSMTGRPSYSVLGAASDHVPLAEYIASAIEEEQKGVIRSAVLAAGDRPVAPERQACKRWARRRTRSCADSLTPVGYRCSSRRSSSRRPTGRPPRGRPMCGSPKDTFCRKRMRATCARRRTRCAGGNSWSSAPQGSQPKSRGPMARRSSPGVCRPISSMAESVHPPPAEVIPSQRTSRSVVPTSG